MDDDESFDFDAEAAMREEMGFSSFSTRRPKAQPDSSFQQSNTATTTNKQTDKTTATNIDSSPNESSSTTKFRTQSSPTLSSKTTLTTATSLAYVFTSPVSNTYYTRTDLEEWARGKVNANGDTVYFKPGFVSIDPWARNRGKDKEVSEG
ncbi:uncharacterized protein Z518_06991 [Rhinocladiella mackenziei CBS 650.93]|uniref:Uncharacterized protein n=1 Tax=Rhinocladiella mackenziei CBS 650.93 TaxID=1442369 RepID=A0A0D2ICA1_9EURO|nr:uncharacterized protein Z518_06991 [Rhinocladiella mackenziei CBS 650.93]KIX03439.1 hypothetical protein Z518_06991 [Rhinocladiella mackenziei CBS 650.93]